MQSLDYLIIMVLIVTIISPAYFLERSRMTKRLHQGKHPAKFYTVWRILSILNINLVLAISYIMLNFFILLGVKGQEGLNYWSFTQLGYLLLFLIVSIVITYGAGMYVTAIASEIYVVKRIKQEKGFSVLDLAHKMFHGPLSHVFMFSGATYMFLAISLMESSIPVEYLHDNTYLMPAYLIVGVILGIIMGAVTIKNLTWEHQIPWIMLEFVLLLIMIQVLQLDLSVHLFTLTTLFMVAMTNIIFLFKIIWANYHGEHYTYARFIPDFLDHDPGETDG